MQLSHIALALPLLFTPLLAQTNAVQSPPFHLSIISTNQTINGALLTSCHEGAAIESLCLVTQFNPPLAPAVYNFNTSSANVTFNPAFGEPGYITWTLPGQQYNYSEALGLYYNTASNVALALFYPGEIEATYFGFDDDEILNIQSYTDDSVFPVVVAERPYYRWYVCFAYYESYTYQTVNWVLGDYPPQNPTCQPVNVTREFI